VASYTNSKVFENIEIVAWWSSANFISKTLAM